MDRNGLLAVIVLFLLVSNVSDALRRLDEDPKVNNTTTQQQVSPLPSSDHKPEDGIKPDENDKKIGDHKVQDNSSLVDSQVATSSSIGDSQTPESSSVVDSHVATNSSVVDSQTPKSSSVVDSHVATNSSVIDSQTPKSSSVVDSQAPSNSSIVDPKGLNNTSSQSSSPTVQNDTNSTTQQPAVKETDDDDKSDQKANKDGDKPEEKIPETCDGLPKKCTDGGSLEACIQNFESGSKDLVILVRNKGKKTLKVSLAVPAYVQSSSTELEIPKHQAEKINISIDISKSSNIIFDSGSGECKLLVNPVVSEPDFFVRLPSFDKLATPVNGAYLLILAGLVLGSTWACCKCRKTKRHDDGVPYQELEMGLPESVSASNVETAQGWDQGWDDDWDDDHAGKSPVGGRTVGSISANGLTARSANKDGWDNDWDD